jgi:hypothetical protein
MKQIKIGILGEIRAGKDTVSELLSYQIREMGSRKPTEFFAFATGIHDVIQLTMPELYQLGKPRQALQGIGQELRKHKPDVWIDYLFNSSAYGWAEVLGQNMIVTDVRQPNEAIRLQEKGFVIIKVTASPEVRIQRAKAVGDNFTPEMLNHETEKAIQLCPYDFLIDNSYSIDELKVRVREILEEVAENE